MNTLDLIIPFAAPQKQLSFLLEGNSSEVSFVQSIMGIHPERFSRIIVALLEKDASRLNLTSLIQDGFAAQQLADKLTIILLPETTESQSETVMQTLERAEISGAFWVKDPDNYFCVEPTADNIVTVFPLDALTRVNPQNKSYISISDGDYILNIAEKRIIGRYFCSGGYGFTDSKKFIQSYHRLKNFGKLYISHIIYRMLLDGVLFRPLYVTEYRDWGSQEDWNEYKKILKNQQ